MSHLPAGLSKPDKPAYCCIPVYAWVIASIPLGLPLLKPFMLFDNPGDILVAAKLFVPRLCKPVRPLKEEVEVERLPDNEAEKEKERQYKIRQKLCVKIAKKHHVCSAKKNSISTYLEIIKQNAVPLTTHLVIIWIWIKQGHLVALPNFVNKKFCKEIVGK